jgi:hypothetical protein
MVASSVSTYLDVTQAAQAAKGASAPARDPSLTDPEFTARAAKVLAALNAGTDSVGDLPERTGLTTSEVLNLLSWLADSGLVEVDEANGVIHAHLTPPTIAALA